MHHLAVGGLLWSDAAMSADSFMQPAGPNLPSALTGSDAVIIMQLSEAANMLERALQIGCDNSMALDSTLDYLAL